MWHKHKFVEQERVFSGCATTTHAEGIHPSALERLVLGITTIIGKCEVCGKLNKTEVLGNAVRN